MVRRVDELRADRPAGGVGNLRVEPDDAVARTELALDSASAAEAAGSRPNVPCRPGRTPQPPAEREQRARVRSAVASV